MEEPYWTKDYISGIRLFVSFVTDESKLIESELSTIKKFNEKCYKPMLSQLKQIESLSEIYGTIATRNISNQLNDLITKCERILYENKIFHDDFMNEISPLYDRYYDSLNKLRGMSPSAVKVQNDNGIDIPNWVAFPYMIDSQFSINSSNEMIQYVQYLRDNIPTIQQYKLLGNKRYFHGNELINTIKNRYPLLDTSQFNINRLGQDLIEMGIIEEYSGRRLYMSKTQLTYDIERDYVWVENKQTSSSEKNSNDLLSQYIIVEENKVSLEIAYCKNCSYYDQKMRPGIITSMNSIEEAFYKIVTEQLFRDIALKPENEKVVRNKKVYGCGYYIRDNGIAIRTNDMQFLFGQIKYDNVEDIVSAIDLIMKQCCNESMNQIDVWHGDINLRKASKLKIMILTKFYDNNVTNTVAIETIIKESCNTTMYHQRDWSDLIKLWLNELPGGILLYDKSVDQLVVSQSYKEIFSVFVRNLLQCMSMEQIARILDVESGGQIMIQSLIRDYNRYDLSMRQLAIKICELVMHWDCDNHTAVAAAIAAASDPDFVPLPYKTTPRI